MSGDLGRLLGRDIESGIVSPFNLDPRDQNAGIGSRIGRGIRLPYTAEDDAIVNTNQGRMPLNQVEGNVQRLPDSFAQDSQGIGYNMGAGVNRGFPALPAFEELLRRR